MSEPSQLSPPCAWPKCGGYVSLGISSAVPTGTGCREATVTRYAPRRNGSACRPKLRPPRNSGPAYTSRTATASPMREPPGKPGERGEAFAMSSTVLEASIAGGLLLAAIVKTVLRYGWRRLTAPRGRHRDDRQTASTRPATRSRSRSLSYDTGILTAGSEQGSRT
jgi:hypothetical protein